MPHLWATPLITAVITCAVALAFSPYCAAQGQPFAEAPAVKPAPAAEPVAKPAPQWSQGPYPPSPGHEFFRGNSRNDPGQSGSYLSMARFVPILAIFLAWACANQWVAADGKQRKIRVDGWNTAIAVSGFLGLLAALCISSYPLGLLALLGAAGAPVGLYIAQRQGGIPQLGDVLTTAPVQNWASRKLKNARQRVSAQNESGNVDEVVRFIPGSLAGASHDHGRSRHGDSSARQLAAKELVYDAVLRGSTDIHLEPRDDEVGVRLRIDGIIYPTESFERSTGEAVINVFKVMSGMNIVEKRRPQNGSFAADVGSRRIDFRAATQATRTGEKLSLRILDRSNAINCIADLGMRKPLQDSLRGIIERKNGLLLCCGPTGAGKSTSLYAAMSEIDPYQRNIITVEDPIEFRIDNVTQIAIDPHADQTFGSMLKSVLRQDPDVVMVGEMNDVETARIGCQAATTGHMVFSTVHANDTVTALFRLIDLGVEPYQVSTAVTAVLGQRLVRKLCPQCKVAYTPKAEFLRRAGIPPQKIGQFYRPPDPSDHICAACGGLGFRGRMGTFELLIVNERIRDLVRQKAPLSAIRGEARKSGMLSLKEEGLRLVVAGITSIDELLRMVQ